MKKSLLLIFSMSMSFCAFSQLTVTPAPTASQIINQLQGNGVQISNVQIYCDSNAYGLFQGTSELPLANGLVLNTGYASGIIGPSNTTLADSCLFHNNVIGWGELVDYEPTATFDYCRISFSITSIGDSLAFGYCFGSEDYFRQNDMAAINITGPDPAGGQYDTLEVSWIASPNQPVCCMNANPILWQSYYLHNNSSQYYSYSGGTIYLQRGVAIVPGQPYYVSISIADVGDCNYDSGLFMDGFWSDSLMTGIATNSSYEFIPVSAELYDLTGRKIWAGAYDDFQAKTDALSSGVYILWRIDQSGNITKQKIGIIK